MRSYLCWLTVLSAVCFTGCEARDEPPKTAETEAASLVESDSTPGLRKAAPIQSTSEAQQAAIEAAQNWLALVDKDQYDQSWTTAAQYLRTAVPKEKWVNSLDAFRRPLGKVVSRKLASQQHRTALPGAPDGQYVILKYETRFQNKRSAVETITPMLDTDGQWHVSGYYIK